MTDGQKDVVENALNECAAEFARGVHSYYAPQRAQGLTIEDGVIDELKGMLRETFEKHLEHEDPARRREWKNDREYVTPMAFYTGALAACYAHNAFVDGKRVTTARADSALQHVSAYCHGSLKEASGEDFRPTWWYCPPWFALGKSGEMVTEQDVISAIEKSEVVSSPETDLARNSKTAKTVTIGCVRIPLPFLKLEICVDLRLGWRLR